MRKYETLTKDLLISWGISDIKIDENEEYGYAIYDRWGKKRKYGSFGAYPGIILRMKGNCYSLSLHRVVYAWFKGDVPSNYDVDHIDENKLNCKLDNLQLISHKENVQKHWQFKKNGMN